MGLHDASQIINARVVNLLRPGFSQVRLEVATFEQFEYYVVGPSVETDANQLHDVCVVELTAHIHVRNRN